MQLIKAIPKITRYKNSSLKVGLLGGSFNPAHKGHLHLSKIILNKFKFDQIWWLVSPQNPLKESKDLLNYQERLKSALEIVKNPRIKVTTIEKDFQLFYTYDTIKKMKSLFPKIKFTWIMGADNLVQFHKWKNWDRIFKLLPIIIYDRAPFGYRCLKSKAAIKYNIFQTSYPLKPVNWKFVRLQNNPLSSTQIRKNLTTQQLKRAKI